MVWNIIGLIALRGLLFNHTQTFLMLPWQFFKITQLLVSILHILSKFGMEAYWVYSSYVFAFQPHLNTYTAINTQFLHCHVFIS